MEQIIFQYKILSGDVLKSQADLRKAIELTNKELQDGSKKSVAQQKALETQLKTLTRIYRGELNAGIRQSKKEFDASGAAGVDAYRKTAAQLALVTRNIKNLRVENKAVPKELRKQFTTLRNQITQADSSVGDFRRNVGNYGSSLKGLGVKLLGAFGFVGGISLIGQQMGEIISDAKQVAIESKGIEFAFDRLGKSGQQAFDDVKESTSGLLSDLDIKKAIVEFDNFNISQDEVGTLLKFVSVRAAQTGKSIDNLRDSLVEGLSKESKLRIDNLGISASELNSELSKTPNFVQAVANIAKRELAEAGNILDEAGNAQSKYNATYQNFLLAISQSDAIQGLATNFLNLKTSILETITPNNLLSDQIVEEQNEINVLVQKITDLNVSQGDRQKAINELDEKYPFFLEKIGKETASNEKLTKRLKEVNELYIQRIILQKEEEKIREAAEILADRTVAILDKEDDIRLRLREANAEHTLALDLNNSTLKQNADAIQAALDKRAEFSLSTKTDNVRLNAEAKSLVNLSKELRELTKATEEKAEASATLTGIEERRDDIVKRLEIDLAALAAQTSGANEGTKTGTDLTEEQVKALEKQRKALEKIIKLEDSITTKEFNELNKFLEDIQKSVDKFNESLTETDVSKIKGTKAITDLRSNLEKANDAIRELRENPPEFAPGLGDGNSASGSLENEREIFARIEQEKVDIAELSSEKRLAIEIQRLEAQKAAQLQLGNDISQINRELAAKDVALVQATEDKKHAIRDAAIMGIANVLNSVFALQQQQDQQRFDRQTDLLDQEYDAKIDAAEGNTEEQERLQEELEEKRRVIAEEAFEKNKSNEIKQALINQAQAIIKAFTAGPIIGPILAAFIAIQAGIQIAKIKSQEFAETGIIIPNQKSDSPIFTQMGEGGSVPLGEFAKGKRHARGGIKAILNGRFVEYEQGEFVDKDEYGNVHVINRRSSFHSRDALKEMASQSFAGKGQILSTINNQTKAGYTKAVEGAVIQSITETPGQVIRREAGLTPIDAKVIGLIIADEVKTAVKDGINELITDQRISQEFENSRSA